MGAIKTILLTGATGYLGGKLVPALLDSNYKVVIVKRVSSVLTKIAPFLDHVKLYNNDEDSISNLFKENTIDIILHTATSYGRKGETFLEIKEANFDFPALLLQHGLNNKVQYFLNTGTSLPVFANTYALLKNQFVQCLELFAGAITSVNVILEHFYGPGDDTSKFISSIAKKMLLGEKQIDLTAGTQLRDFIYIDDVVTAYIKLIDNMTNFTGYNKIPVGSGEVVPIREIVELIKMYAGSSSQLNFGAIAMRENELLKSNADISKLSEFGWKQKIDLHTGLKLTIDDMLN